MEQAGVTWIVVADGTAARFFCERTRMAPLQEIHASRMTATDEERVAGHHHRGDKRAPQHEPERRFLNRVARRITLGARAGQFQHLVLMGPPRALGTLKTALPDDVVVRLEATDDHSRRDDDPTTLRHHLGKARARKCDDGQAGEAAPRHG